MPIILYLRAEEMCRRGYALTWGIKYSITHVQKGLNTPTGLSYPQLYTVTSQIIIGGAETISTILSFTSYLLLTTSNFASSTPSTKDKVTCPSPITLLTSELRSLFSSSSEITTQNINNLTQEGKLEYLHAVLQEAIRLYAPTPGNLIRVTPDSGLHIQTSEKDYLVPGGTLLGVNLHATGRMQEIS